MDINKVTLKGQIVGEVTFRESETGEWCNFGVKTTLPKEYENVSKNACDPMLNQVIVFKPELLQKLKNAGAKTSDTVWVEGTIYVRRLKKQSGGFSVYFSVAAIELDVIKKNKV